MKAFRNMRIRSQLNVIVCVAAALLVLTMAAVYIAFDAIMTRMAEERFRDLAVNSGSSVRTMLRGIEANDRNYAYILEKSGFPVFQELEVDMKRIVADAYASMRSVSEDMRGIAVLTGWSDPLYAGVEEEGRNVMERLMEQDNLAEGEEVHPYFTKALTGADGGFRYFAHVAPILQSANPERAGGYLITLFDYSSVRAVLETLAGGDPRNLGLLLEDGRILAVTEELTEAERSRISDWFRADASTGSASARRYVKYRRASSLALSMPVSGTDWHLAVLVSADVIKAPILSLIWIGLAILVAGATILAIASVATIRAITEPVEGIAGAMAEIGGTQGHRVVEVTSRNEVGILANHINAMLQTLEVSDHRARTAEKRLYEADLARMRMELAWYQSQINPHFLYNTLESIRSMAVVYGANEIGELAVATAGIFRYATRQEQEVPLQDELNCVEAYMTVMQLRFPDRYSLKIRVTEADRDIQLYRMLLQPIVENCFKHGFAGKSGNGVVHIRTRRTGACCLITITDNGTGISMEKLNILRARLDESGEPQGFGTSDAGNPSDAPGTDSGAGSSNLRDTGARVGLINIHQRLRLGYGDAFGLTAESREGKWTRLSLLVPARNA